MLELNFIKSRIGCSTLICVMVGSVLLLGSSAYAQENKKIHIDKMEIHCPIFDPSKKCELIERGELKGEYSCFGVKFTDPVSKEKHSWIGVLEGTPKKVTKPGFAPGNTLKCEYEGTEGKENYLTTVTAKEWECAPNEKNNGFKCLKIVGKETKTPKSKQ